MWSLRSDHLKWDAERNHFNWPLGLALDAQDRLYIADSCNNRIVRMTDMTGAGWQTLDNLDHPVSVRAALDGRLYVGLAYHPGLHLYSPINEDGHRIMRTKSGTRGILAPAGK